VGGLGFNTNFQSSYSTNNIQGGGYGVPVQTQYTAVSAVRPNPYAPNLIPKSSTLPTFGLNFQGYSAVRDSSDMPPAGQKDVGRSRSGWGSGDDEPVSFLNIILIETFGYTPDFFIAEPDGYLCQRYHEYNKRSHKYDFWGEKRCQGCQKGSGTEDCEQNRRNWRIRYSANKRFNLFYQWYCQCHVTSDELPNLRQKDRTVHGNKSDKVELLFSFKCKILNVLTSNVLETA